MMIEFIFPRYITKHEYHISDIILTKCLKFTNQIKIKWILLLIIENFLHNINICKIWCKKESFNKKKKSLKKCTLKVKHPPLNLLIVNLY